MARKGQFKKGGGRHGHGGSRKRRSHSKAIVRTKTRRVYVGGSKRRRRSGGRKGSGPMKLTHLALATAGLAFITKAGATAGFQKSINDAMDKVPGTKTFGATAMLGLGLLAIDRFVKPNKWLKLAGTAGIVLAAAQVGTKGSEFKFLGDDSTGDFDLQDVDDVDDVDDFIEDDE